MPARTQAPCRSPTPRAASHRHTQGLWMLAADATRRAWKLSGPQFLGNMVHHAVLDRVTARRFSLRRHRHLGPTVFRSVDGGKTWKEAAKPPAFAPDSGRVVDHTFWLTPGHASQPGAWYAGTSPARIVSLRRRRCDVGGCGGDSMRTRNARPGAGGDQDGTPDGPKLHSILVDPRDPMHMYLGMSGGGVFESVDGVPTGIR